MKVLIVGGGGREHAIAWKLAQNTEIKEIYCAPGNAGIAQLAQCVPLKATDIAGIARFVAEKGIDYTVIGPDDPLAMGLTDRLLAQGSKVFGPTQAAARIESSKIFSKNLMKKYNIPTAEYAVFTGKEDALFYVEKASFPLVIKADGLALGKGVFIVSCVNEAKEAIHELMEAKSFGAAGEKIIIEEHLKGPEVSVLCFCDGKTILPMLSAQDHKRAFDLDQGPNTGGMGAVSPANHFDARLKPAIRAEILEPALEAMNREGAPFSGVLFVGLMLTGKGPKVLEFNARFGDPETQVVLPRLRTDLFEVMQAVSAQRLHTVQLEWEKEASAGVVMASGGYPGSYETGKEITGLSDVPKDVLVFHAGTKAENGRTLTAGGRVLCVVGRGEDTPAACKRAYEGVSRISFEGAFCRGDIGSR